MAAGLAIGCSSSPGRIDTTVGEALFTGESLGGLQGCGGCHSVTSRASVGGPLLLGIGSRAGSRVDGLDADDYLRQSIVAPTAYLAAGWGPGMPAYGHVLTTAQVDALVDYLLSLR